MINSKINENLFIYSVIYLGLLMYELFYWIKF